MLGNPVLRIVRNGAVWPKAGQSRFLRHRFVPADVPAAYVTPILNHPSNPLGHALHVSLTQASRRPMAVGDSGLSIARRKGIADQVEIFDRRAQLVIKAA